MNVDALRKKRSKRLGIKSPAGSGQRRIFHILDRATKKHHGDIGLWMQYIEYTRKQKAHKKLSRIFTNVLRLHPTKPELWIYAAQYVLGEHADMTEARSYMQRGLRFCKNSKNMWLEYVKLEMIYIAKVATRRRILGLDMSRKKDLGEPIDDPDADVVALPPITGEDVNPSVGKYDDVDKVALENLKSTPALSGAIPIAIFDAAMKQFGNDDLLGRKFYDTIAQFEETPCLPKILTHVVEGLLTNSPGNYDTYVCHIKVAVVGITVDSPDFPQAFAISLSRWKAYISLQTQKLNLAVEMVSWLVPFLNADRLDPALRKVITVTLRNAVHTVEENSDEDGGINKKEYAEMVKLLHGISFESNENAA